LGKYRESIKACDYLIDYYWQQKDTSLAALWHSRKGFHIYEGWNDLIAANQEMSKTFSFQKSIDHDLYWTGLTFYHVLNNKYELAENLAKSTSIKWWYISVLSLIHSKKMECTESESIIDSIGKAGPVGSIKILLYYPLAKCHFEKNNYDKAVQYLLRIQTINELSFGFRACYLPKSYYLLGKSYEKLNDIDSAKKYYHKFLDMWKNADEDLPDLIDAKKRLANLTEGN